MAAQLLLFLLSAWFIQNPAAQNQAAQNPEADAAAAALRTLVASAPKLPLEQTAVAAIPPEADWAMGMVSWVAVDRTGLTYLLQRGDKANPIVVVDRDRRVVRSWGKGLYVMPHAIRVDPNGNIWTTDAASSMVYKFSPRGDVLLKIAVGGQPTPCPNNFCGTTDVAFAQNGHVFVADGYSNARVLEYSADGVKVREWGTAGTGPGQFHLPHSIQIDERGVVYVADRENGRVQRFDLEGKYLGEWSTFGKTFSLKVQPGVLWLATQPRNQPNLTPGWVLKIDRQTGRILGAIDATGLHGMDVGDTGDAIVGPGPRGAGPQWFKRSQ
jgi:streptogramin lyase